MPCFRCSKIQTDPVKGASPWGRLVLKGEQVLLCPDCQVKDPAWKALGDRCASCGGTRLTVIMGAAVCKECGADAPLP